MVSLSDQLADVHTRFGATRDRLYELIAAADFKSAAVTCNELASLFARYRKVREGMALKAQAEVLANPRWAKSKSRAHLLAVAAKGRTDQLDELLTREAIAALDKEQEDDE